MFKNDVSKLRNISQSFFSRRAAGLRSISHHRQQQKNQAYRSNLSKKGNTLATIIEDDEDDFSEMYDDWVQRCIDLLSSDDANDNLFGIKTLIEIIVDKHIGVSEQVSHALIYGGDEKEEKLRLLFPPFLHDDDDYDDDVSDYFNEDDNLFSDYSTSDYDIDDSFSIEEFLKGQYEKETDTTNNEVIIKDSELFDDETISTASNSISSADDDDTLSQHCIIEDDEESFQSKVKEKGIHHKNCLELLFYALRIVSQSDDLESKSIDFTEPFWKHAVTSLIDNIETNYTDEITSTSLACFRLLHTLEPTYVEPFINHALSPYLYQLRDSKDCPPTIQSEASRLLARGAQNFPLRIFEI